MTDTDLIRLKWLMEHYLKPYTRSHKELAKYRKLFTGGKLPDNSAYPSSEEWEGPFFCRIIEELLTETQKKSLLEIVLGTFKKLEHRHGQRRQ
jgi:hypothetical protein